MKKNVDDAVVRGFGEEWSHFDQAALDAAELARQFESYFRIFPWHKLPANARGIDIGCGSGRWAKLVAPRVGELHCIDASEEAIKVAKRNLAGQGNCSFHVASLDEMPLEDGSMDFGYALGVLHHVPDTQGAVRNCARKLKPGAPFLLYLYFAFDNRPAWYRSLWRVTEPVRKVVSRSPFPVRLSVSFAFALLVYWPLARLALLLEKAGYRVESIPLSIYRDRSFYSMRTDALDRFGTRLEKRFTRAQITEMLVSAGFEQITFSLDQPYWCAVAFKK